MTPLTADGFTAMEFRGSPYYQHRPCIQSEWLQPRVHGDGTPGLSG
jgi:hypothetical protein